jgi:hypothetical protein
MIAMRAAAAVAVLGLGLAVGLAQEKPKSANPPAVLEKSFTTPNDLKVTVRATKPQDLPSDLQIMGYFKHDPKGDVVISVIIDFDKMMGNPIKSLRDRGAFVGDELETLTFTPPEGVMKPKKLMLIGYGDKEKFSLETLRRIGTVSVREAVRLGAKRVAFAPAVKDQGFDKFDTGDVEKENVQGIILAYDTEKRLQAEGLSKAFSIEEYILESGPEYFERTIKGVADGVKLAEAALAKRDKAPYHSLTK